MTFNFGSNRKNADMILRAASTLARLLERWPHPLKFGTKSMRILADVALELASQRLSKLYPTIDMDPSKSFTQVA